MSINVYWACMEDEWMRAEVPHSILKSFFEETPLQESGLARCPSIRDELSNTYGLKSIYDFEFTIVNNEVGTNYHDQDFFNNHLVIRSIKEKVFSFTQKFIFFTDSPSLLMTGNILPSLEKNHITERCMMPPGQFDIGKWFRPVEFSFILKPNENTFKISAGDTYQYIKFHTNDKINFIQFYHTDEIARLVNSVMNAKAYNKQNSILSYFYKIFKLKNRVLREIKDNVL